MITAIKRFTRENEFAYLFITNPVAQIAAFIALLCIGGAALSPWIAPFNPYDIASIDLMDSLMPPAWVADSDPRFLRLFRNLHGSIAI